MVFPFTRVPLRSAFLGQEKVPAQPSPPSSETDIDLMRQAALAVEASGADVLNSLLNIERQFETWDPREIDGAFEGIMSVLTLGTYWAWDTATEIEKAIGRVAAGIQVGQMWLNAAQKDFFGPMGEQLYAADPEAYGYASNVFEDVRIAQGRLVDLKVELSQLPIHIVKSAVDTFLKGVERDVLAFSDTLRKILDALGGSTAELAKYVPWILGGLGVIAVGVFLYPYLFRAVGPSPVRRVPMSPTMEVSP